MCRAQRWPHSKRAIPHSSHSPTLSPNSSLRRLDREALSISDEASERVKNNRRLRSTGCDVMAGDSSCQISTNDRESGTDNDVHGSNGRNRVAPSGTRRISGSTIAAIRALNISNSSVSASMGSSSTSRTPGWGAPRGLSAGAGLGKPSFVAELMLPDRRQRFCKISTTLQCGIMKVVPCRRSAFACD